MKDVGLALVSMVVLWVLYGIAYAIAGALPVGEISRAALSVLAAGGFAASFCFTSNMS